MGHQHPGRLVSKALDRLHALRIHNPHNAATFARRRGGIGVYVDRRPQTPGRGYQSAAWQVITTTPGVYTDPNGHWRDYKHKTFNVFGREHDSARCEEAIAWAAEFTGTQPDDWVRIPGLPRAFFPRGDARIVTTAVKEET